MNQDLLTIKNLYKDFPRQGGVFKKGGGFLRALSGISLSAKNRQTLGIIGESGSGKTTLAKIILRLLPPTSGRIIFDQRLITNFRKDVQIIFQNPYGSLDPKMRVIQAISEPLLVHRITEKRHFKDKSVELLKLAGLDDRILNRYPLELSGGQRQRVCIARALATSPKFIVLDEPISSLDLTIQAQMLDLFIKLKHELNLTYIFISHNLAVVKHLADEIIVMKDGRIVEQGTAQMIFSNPLDPYTRELLESARG